MMMFVYCTSDVDNDDDDDFGVEVPDDFCLGDDNVPEPVEPMGMVPKKDCRLFIAFFPFSSHSFFF